MHRPTRRDFLRHLVAGFGALAFDGLALADTKSPLAPRRPPLRARARRVIFLCMRGGPSHVDTFDYKPALRRDAGKRSPAGPAWFPSPWEFAQHGESGLWISELFPALATHADELCLLAGMHCDQPAHAQAFIQMHTGTAQFVRPSLGAWILYGLGTESADLPGYISLNPPTANGGAQNYGHAFLPGAFAGTRLTVEDSSQRDRPIDRRRRGEPNPDGIDDARNALLGRDSQRAQLDLVQALHEEQLRRDESPLVEAAIESMERAFRMQDAVPGLLDIADESDEVRALYGLDDPVTAGFGRQCLLARRFAEAGVRFVELGHGSWDQHSNIEQALAANCAETDRPIAGLLTDLRRRGLLDDTLVVWGGEFGRSPWSVDGRGRDHNHEGYTMWMAGGGVRGGMQHGATDEHGAEAVEGRVHIADWHATVLHLLGLDHEALSFRHAGREMRLTDGEGRVVEEIIG